MSLSTLEALRRGDLAGARTLRLNGLGLEAVPPEVFALRDTLEELDLGNNRLSELPPAMATLGRLRVIFGSNNPFPLLPPVLGGCAALTQVGFRGTGLREVPAESLPLRLRWLTLTDNAIGTLPAALGERPALQKLMLAGNRLEQLPEGLAGAPSLELLRIGANRFEALPPWLTALPQLCWLGYAGNPAEPAMRGAAAVPDVPWEAIEPGAALGEGASGRVQAALWHGQAGAAPRPVALKLFRGAMTSDGLPGHEIAASLAAGAHPNLAGALGRVMGHPEGVEGLLLPLLPEGWRALAGPPSLAGCTRDDYAPALRLPWPVARRLALAAGAGAAQLHGRGLLHGDLYAHNLLWDGRAGEAVLSDLGAASVLPGGEDGLAMQRLEVRAWGLLLEELIARAEAVPEAARAVAARCVQPVPADRPLMAEALRALEACA
ncbi:hypothetical protein [Roseomonas elaeocarpi]|uniref:Protein kinase domain-containing protein n=1 Tax=Roseomonas elaeocarpi TaxID=907779 RepID=A0ABV6JNN4_9PROT